MLQPTKDELARRQERFTQHLTADTQTVAPLRKGQPLDVADDKSRAKLSRILSDPKVSKVLDATAAPARRTVALVSNSSKAVFQVLSKVKVTGRCQTLEKNYLRLTAPPHPDNVRPAEVLTKSFALVKQKFESGERDYVYANSQLKSIRQDLMVQRIETQLTVDVYEYHARIALALNDYGELQQALTRLQYLYAATPHTANKEEFLCYHVLFDSLPSKRQSQSDTVRRLTPAERALPRVAFATAVRKALRTENSYQFFRLCRAATELERALLEDMLVNVRVHALHCALLAYRPSVSLAALAVITGFAAPDAADGERSRGEETGALAGLSAKEVAAAREREMVACANYLLTHGCVWTAESEAVARRSFKVCHQPGVDKAGKQGKTGAQGKAGPVSPQQTPHHITGLTADCEKDFAAKVLVDGKMSLAGFTEWQRRHNEALLAAQASTLLDEDAVLPASGKRVGAGTDAAKDAWLRTVITAAPTTSKRKLVDNDDEGKKAKREKSEDRSSSTKSRSSSSKSSKSSTKSSSKSSSKSKTSSKSSSTSKSSSHSSKKDKKEKKKKSSK